MASGDLVTADGHFEAAGLLLNTGATDDASGIHFSTLDGLALPVTRDTFEPRVNGGSSAGVQRSDGRQIIARSVIVESDDTLGDLRLAMKRRSDPIDLVWQGIAGRSTGKLLVRAYPVGMDFAVDDEAWRNALYAVDLEWFAPDPHVYSLTNHTETIDSSASTVTNTGDDDAYWSVEIAGPCVNPRVRLSPDFEANTFYYRGTVASGKTLTINSRPDRPTATIDGRSVLGACSGYSADDVPAFFPLDPGDNDVRFGSDSGTSSVTFAWRDSWC